MYHAEKHGFLHAQNPEDESDAALFGGGRGRMMSGDAEEGSDMALFGSYQGQTSHQPQSAEDDSGSESDLALYGGGRGRAHSGVAEEGSDAALYGGAASLMQSSKGQRKDADDKIEQDSDGAAQERSDNAFYKDG